MRAIRPLSNADARLLCAPETQPDQRLPPRLLHARALLTIRCYEEAAAELRQLRPLLPQGLLRARAEADLLLLTYYLGGREGARELFDSARVWASARPALLAELYLALSLAMMADNDTRTAMDAIRFAEDALVAERPGSDADLVRCRIQRQLAYVACQKALYAEARQAAEQSVGLATVMNDAGELEASQTSLGFVLWTAGEARRAAATFQSVEQTTQLTKGPLWRWIVLCLARIHSELGDHATAEQFANQSAFDAPEEYAFLAVARGDARTALAILTRGRTPSAAEQPFRLVVEGIALTRDDRPRDAIPKLQAATADFRTCGLDHYALGAAIHLAFAQDTVRRGAGRRQAATLLRELQAAAASGFAWFDVGVARWLLRAGGRDSSTQAIRSSLDDRLRDDGLPREFGARCRHVGLTSRETEILSALRRSRGTESRGQLAQRLGISAATLRVHLWHVRAKLAVARAASDVEIIEALEGPCDWSVVRTTSPPGTS